MAKRYFTFDDLSGDKDTALRPAVITYRVPDSDVDYSPLYRRWQSAATIAKTPGGVLWCGFSGDNGNGKEGPNNYNTLSFSRDDGQTWEHNVVVIDHPDSVRLHEPILWTAPDGTLYHFWSQSYRHWDGRGGVWMIRNTHPDQAPLDWSEPKRICDGVLALKPIVLKSGEWMFPISLWKRFKSKYNSLPDITHSNVVVTNDECKTMRFVGYAEELRTTYDENAIVERTDGSILMLMRTEDGIAYSESFDQGKTWTDSSVFVLPGPSSRLYLDRYDDGSLLIVTHYKFTGRSHMTALRSFDGGKSWKELLLLDERKGVSYPDGFVDKDGTAYVVYDHNRTEDREILLAVFDPDGNPKQLKTIVSKCP